METPDALPEGNPITGAELRALADRAWAWGQKETGAALHDAARVQEAEERVAA